MWFSLAGRAQSPAAAGGDFSTNFPATENPLSQGGIWLNGGTDGLDWTDCQTASGLLGATSIESAPPPYNDSTACLKTAYRAFNARQFAQGVIHRASGYTTGHEALLLLRWSISAHVARGYELYWSTNGGLTIVRWNGPVNDFNAIATTSPGLAANGDTVRFEADGSNLAAKINGSTVLTISDSAWATGQPGLGNNPYGAGSDFFSYGWSSYTAGDLP